jgi:hypothetical protein
METLLRYDLAFNSQPGYGNQSINDLNRYNRLLSLNRTELGYLIKCVSPEDCSNFFQGEHPEHDILYGDLVLDTYRNFLKLLTKRLNLKINQVVLRYCRNAFRGVWDILQEDFPALKFVVCQQDDSSFQRNVGNTAHLLAWLYLNNQVIWQWQFPEIGLESLESDQGYRSSTLSAQEQWCYKNFDPVFGLPTIARFTHLRVRKMIVETALYIHWPGDRIDLSMKVEH